MSDSGSFSMIQDGKQGICVTVLSFDIGFFKVEKIFFFKSKQHMCLLSVGKYFHSFCNHANSFGQSCIHQAAKSLKRGHGEKQR